MNATMKKHGFYATQLRAYGPRHIVVAGGTLCGRRINNEWPFHKWEHLSARSCKSCAETWWERFGFRTGCEYCITRLMEVRER